MPLYSDVVDALERWRELCDEVPELADNPFLFPRLGRRRRDGSFPDADGHLSTTAVRIVRPNMLAAEHRRIERLQRRPARPPPGASARASRGQGGVRKRAK